MQAFRPVLRFKIRARKAWSPVSSPASTSADPHAQLPCSRIFASSVAAVVSGDIRGDRSLDVGETMTRTGQGTLLPNRFHSASQTRATRMRAATQVLALQGVCVMGGRGLEPRTSCL